MCAWSTHFVASNVLQLSIHLQFCECLCKTFRHERVQHIVAMRGRPAGIVANEGQHQRQLRAHLALYLLRHCPHHLSRLHSKGEHLSFYF